jgi:hypothetical protein
MICATVSVRRCPAARFGGEERTVGIAVEGLARLCVTAPCDLCLYPVCQGPAVTGIDAGQGNGMAGIRGEIIIARPVDVVFDYVADQSNEPQ